MESPGPIETELTSQLLACAEAFVAATGMSENTLADQAAGDWRFIERLRDPKPSFTARKYDEVMAWFAANWPEGVRWPKGVPARTRFAAPEAAP
jgi:hypothetical protein